MSLVKKVNACKSYLNGRQYLKSIQKRTSIVTNMYWHLSTSFFQNLLFLFFKTKGLFYLKIPQISLKNFLLHYCCCCCFILPISLLFIIVCPFLHVHCLLSLFSSFLNKDSAMILLNILLKYLLSLNFIVLFAVSCKKKIRSVKIYKILMFW